MTNRLEFPDGTCVLLTELRPRNQVSARWRWAWSGQPETRSAAEDKTGMAVGDQLSLANRHTAGEDFGVAQVVRAPVFNEITARAVRADNVNHARGGGFVPIWRCPFPAQIAHGLAITQPSPPPFRQIGYG